MSKKKQSKLAPIRKTLISALVLAIFAFPAVAGAFWVKEIVMGRDTRKVYAQNSLHTCAEPDTSEIKPFEQPLVTVTFDDGWESIYTNGLPVLEELCIDSTQYILGDHFSENNYISRKQALSFIEFGHEIGSHTMTHPDLTQLSSNQLFWELDQSKYLLSAEFGEVKDFASPLGAFDDDVLGQIKGIYRSHRNTAGDPAIVGDEDINLKGGFNRYNIIAYAVRKTTTPEDISRLVDYAKSKNGWLVLVYHQIDESNEEFATTPELFKRQMEVIKLSGVQTPVMGSVLDAIESKEVEND